MSGGALQLFVQATPGLDEPLQRELATLGCSAKPVTGGLDVAASLDVVQRIALESRLAAGVLVRIARFPAQHLAELHKKAAKLDWKRWLRADQPVRIDVSCHASRIYHSGAAKERVANAIAECFGGAPPAAATNTPAHGLAKVHVRLDHDLCTLSLDACGEPLYKRGYKLDTAKAPLRENLAAGLLAMLGWDGTRALVDPMCGSGTIPIEAALLARGMAPGALRRFAFEAWPGHDAARFAELRGRARTPRRQAPPIVARDRNAGAIAAARANAERAGVDDAIHFEVAPLSSAAPPTPLGLLLTNPPYGARIRGGPDLRDLYASLGKLARGPFAAWDVAFLTSEPTLAHATEVPTETAGPILPHGGTKVRLYRVAR